MGYGLSRLCCLREEVMGLVCVGGGRAYRAFRMQSRPDPMLQAPFPASFLLYIYFCLQRFL